MKDDIDMATLERAIGDMMNDKKALLTDEPLFPKNKAYRWTVDHLLTLSDPLDPEIFRYTFETVSGK